MTDQHVAETRAAAATIEHEWDARALDWPLTADSVVVEVGGYKGRWALQIAERYAPRLYVFEPQPWAAAVCRAVLGDRACVDGYALGTHDHAAMMGDWETDGCSLVKVGDHAVEVREIGAAFAVLGIEQIDLMLINIEGYEYLLLLHMLNRSILPQRLMVQFHAFAGDTDAIRALLDPHYTVAWDYHALTAWERR